MFTLKNCVVYRCQFVFYSLDEKKYIVNIYIYMEKNTEIHYFTI